PFFPPQLCLLPPPRCTTLVSQQLLYLPSLGACVLAGCLLRKLSARDMVVVLVLSAWCLGFGARTISRCLDWRSERHLFEAALKVCPDGIKTLNNLATQMLNEEEAPRAAKLLSRAIEV
ncbi:unnamed protein product, partial [Choristocarpus tenellus]